MSLPWIIELELPSGAFSTSRLAEAIPTEELDAEIQDVHALLRQTLSEVMLSPSLSIEREIDQADDSSFPPKLFLMVGYLYDKEAAIELSQRLSELFADTTLPWSEEDVDKMNRLCGRFYDSYPPPK